MKGKMLIIGTLFFSSFALMSFRKADRNYDAMWKKFEKSIENNLPETAEKQLDAIAAAARKDKNQPQLLKTVLYYRQVFELKSEEPEKDFINYASSCFSRLDKASAAILHVELADVYESYLRSNSWQIGENKPVDADMSKVEMKYWDEKTFRAVIDSHYVLALQDPETLKKASVFEYCMVFKDLEARIENMRYEKSVFEFVFHRVANYYAKICTMDDVSPEWNADLWWADAEDFVKSDLPKGDHALLRCLKVYQEILAYSLEKGDENVMLYNDVRRYKFLNSVMGKDELFMSKLPSLMEKYAANPMSAEIASVYAKSLVEAYRVSDSSTHGNYRKAMEICRDAIAGFPKSEGAEQCQEIVDFLEHGEISVSMQQAQLPCQAIAAQLTYRNVQHPYVKLIKVSEEELESLNNISHDELIKKLVAKEAAAEMIMDLPAESDYCEHSTLVALPSLNLGQYFLLAMPKKGTKNENEIIIMRFQVTQLGYVINYEEKSIALYAVDRKSGAPLPKVGVELLTRRFNYERRSYETIRLASFVTDADGKVRIDKKDEAASFFINLRKGDDVLLSEQYLKVPSPSESESVVYHTSLFTDRAIYRPGQTVYFKGIVVRSLGDDKTLAEQFDETINFRDANWQDIASLKFTTDEFGAFSGSFVIPTDRLNGYYRLNGSYGSTSFCVEEYKRPTFEVSFDSPDEQYKLNKDVTVHGSVNAYAGFGLDDAMYTYRVTRRTSFPWRCWWWSYPSVNDEQICFGQANTDGNGRFAITFNLKPSKAVEPKHQPVFTYEIEVTATSAQGETHSATYTIRAGYNEICLSTNLSQMMEKSQMKASRIEVLNMSGRPAKSKVVRRFYRFDDNGRIGFHEAVGENTRFDRQIMTDEELVKAFPCYDYYAGSYREKAKSLFYEDSLDVEASVPLFPEKVDFETGRYYVELRSLDDTLALNSEEFTIYDKSSSKMPYTAMQWCELDETTARPGDEITLSLGSSANNVNVWVQLMAGNEKRLEKWVRVNNNVVRLSYQVKEEDRGGLTFKTLFVKDNVVSQNMKSVSVPFDNLDLNVELATVRDVLSPGAEEHWEVTVRDKDGRPVESSLLAGMYDASLDAFTYHYWGFSMKPYSKYVKNYLHDRQYGFITSDSERDYIYIAPLFGFSLPSDFPFIRVVGLWRGYGQKMFLCEDLESMPVCYSEKADVAMNSMDKRLVVEEDAIEESVTEQEEPVVEPKEENVPNIRENFNETAFFFPNLRTNADGSATFSFTMPDALTRWKLMMMAYTKDRRVGSNTYSFKSSKPVMMMADMPRYMYDADTLWLVANVINTGDESVTPKARLEVFDAATMKPVDVIVSDELVQMGQIVPGRSMKVRWKVAAKKDLGLLAFRFTAYAGQFCDAEQHLLPVLSSEVFMTQTLPITVMAESEQTFDFESIANPESHERDYSMTLNFSTNPVWYAVQSLPYLAEQKTDRAENAFYVFYANTLSSYIASKVPNLANYIRKWQVETPEALMSQLEKDEDLKAIMLRETPWVLEAKSETEQMARLNALFDLNAFAQGQTSSLMLMSGKQTVNGGWPWMEGMPESPYITTYILSGMGKLKAMQALSVLSDGNGKLANEIVDKAVRYLEHEVAESYREMRRLKKQWSIGPMTMNELYALSFFPVQKSDSYFSEAKAYYLERLEKEWMDFDFNARSKAALLLFRSGKEKTARMIIQSFKECAQKNDAIGMYWPKKYFSFDSHIATHANIMAAFAEIENDSDMLDQLRVWLLTQKQTNQWENSSSTAEAIYALLMRGTDWLVDEKEVTLAFGSRQIDMNNAVAGTGFTQRRWSACEITEEMRRLIVDNPTKHLVWGGLFRQYFVPVDEVQSSESAFKIERRMYVEQVGDKGKVLVPVEKKPLKVGDKLVVRITFESKQDMEFVFVKDLRAAGFEPVDQISHYEYSDRMCYYQTNTDTDMEFFIEFLPKGVHQVEYDMYVTKEGDLSNGYALIQCLYAPEFSSYSSGMRIKVGE